ncbi:hypothetical protein G6M89_08730 [Natronolimnobius sp. AArcel1]|uniref:hypothetical protein n=1 Tax=Natronolimnobius sp. AArcel1 TaxID=1679093 RepID=UPI0013E9D8AF|nr:hypothetical protein [Natronolimnobius sp. AArcel1]NGM69091.1 hypothetical protein [Natronolimnobius sp. AArcel1]
MVESANQGMVYLAVGEEFIKEAKVSASQTKAVMPETSITLISNSDSAYDEFDNHIQIDNPRYDGGDRVFHANKTPYDKTIFLDTDIYLTEPIYDVFDLLNNFDVAACIDQRKFASDRIDISKMGSVPESFPEYNGGMIAFQQNNRVNDFLERWRQAYQEVTKQGQIHNQAALRIALYQSDVRIATMRNEYNCVFRRPGCVNGPVKVFHGRLIDLSSYGAEKRVQVKQAVSELNRQDDLRIYYRVGDRVQLKEPSIIERFRYSIKDRGVKKTIKRGMNGLFKSV